MIFPSLRCPIPRVIAEPHPGYFRRWTAAWVPWKRATRAAAPQSIETSEAEGSRLDDERGPVLEVLP
jgi:hypothetical protein